MSDIQLKSRFVAVDGMSPVIEKISNTLNRMNGHFQKVQETANKQQNINAFKSTKEGIDSTNTSMLKNIGLTEILKGKFGDMANEIGIGTESQKLFTNAINASTGAVKGLMLAFLPLLALTAAVSAVMGSVKAVDEYTQLNARLNLMNDGLQTTAQLNDKIYESAQRSRGSYIAMADSVAKLGILAGSAFKNNDEMVFFVEQLNKQFKISGASAEEAKSAMFQLTQAMASGRLQGDEFRTVMENAPLLANAIAKEMGIPLGQLKQLSSQGIITSEVIKNALVHSADETNERFKQIPMTFSDMMTMLENVGKKAFQPILNGIGEIIQSEGFQSFIAMIANGLIGVATITEGAFNLISMAVNQIAFSFDVISGELSILFGLLDAFAPLVTVAFGAYLGYLTAINAESMANAVITGVMAVKQNLLAAKTSFLTAVTNGQAIAQKILNIVMTMNPIGIVITLIGLLIGAFVACSIATNGLRNSLASAWYSMVNTVGFAINKMIDMINGLVSVLNTVGGTLGKVFGFEYNVVGKIGHVNVEGIAKGGSDFIKNFDVHNLMKMPTMTDGGANLTGVGGVGGISSGMPDAMNNIADNTGKTASNTGRVADAVEQSVEDMQTLREMAISDGVNNITRQEIKLDITNHNTINSEMDIDGVGDHIGRVLLDTIKNSKEG